MGKWAVAMSGGVDSSVAAALLAAEGHQVVGLTMNLWPDWLPEPDDAFKACCGVSAIEDARAVARGLGIRHYVLNMREEFERAVISYFASEYAHGRTPNPCIACNQAIKFALLLHKVTALGLDGVATGHYARLEHDPASGRYHLLRARDLHKDQSYVLYGLTQAQLSQLRLPVGEYTKAQTRELARQFGLPVADKPDSQEICFVPRGSYADVVARFHPEALRPGPILDTTGRVLGEHRGIARYTVGQRRGLGNFLRPGAPRQRSRQAGQADGEPTYVVAIDPQRNAVIVGAEQDLLCDELMASDVNWIGIASLDAPRPVTARVRHASRDVEATARPGTGLAEIIVRFAQPQRAPSPGQAVTLYDGDLVLGGGTITTVRAPARALA